MGQKIRFASLTCGKGVEVVIPGTIPEGVKTPFLKLGVGTLEVHKVF